MTTRPERTPSPPPNREINSDELKALAIARGSIGCGDWRLETGEKRKEEKRSESTGYSSVDSPYRPCLALPPPCLALPCSYQNDEITKELEAQGVESIREETSGDPADSSSSHPTPNALQQLYIHDVAADIMDERAAIIVAYIACKSIASAPIFTMERRKRVRQSDNNSKMLAEKRKREIN